MIKVQREDFDVGLELEKLSKGNPRIGGVASFIGLVRDMGGADRIDGCLSIHHQAVRSVAPDLTVAALAPDGTVEALDAAFAHPYFFAVQWHPEAMPADAVSRRLFGGLIEAARLAQVK